VHHEEPACEDNTHPGLARRDCASTFAVFAFVAVVAVVAVVLIFVSVVSVVTTSRTLERLLRFACILFGKLRMEHMLVDLRVGILTLRERGGAERKNFHVQIDDYILCVHRKSGRQTEKSVLSLWKVSRPLLSAESSG